MKAKIYLIFNEKGDFLRTRVVTKNVSRYSAPAEEWGERNRFVSSAGIKSCFITPRTVSVSEAARNYDKRVKLKAVLVAKIGVDYV